MRCGGRTPDPIQQLEAKVACRAARVSKRVTQNSSVPILVSNLENRSSSRPAANESRPIQRMIDHRDLRRVSELIPLFKARNRKLRSAVLCKRTDRLVSRIRTLRNLVHVSQRIQIGIRWRTKSADDVAYAANLNLARNHIMIEIRTSGALRIGIAYALRDVSNRCQNHRAVCLCRSDIQRSANRSEQVPGRRLRKIDTVRVHVP